MHRPLDESSLKAIRAAQRNEITEALVYERLARATRDPANAEVLRRIASEERRHYESWRSITGIEARSRRLVALFHYAVSRFLGLAFGTHHSAVDQGATRRRCRRPSARVRQRARAGGAGREVGEEARRRPSLPLV
jgi:hypothetical protein